MIYDILNKLKSIKIQILNFDNKGDKQVQKNKQKGQHNFNASVGGG